MPTGSVVSASASRKDIKGLASASEAQQQNLHSKFNVGRAV